ncbi:MAG: tetratricopeptide repeat protein [Phycisphaerae bacterium]
MTAPTLINRSQTTVWARASRGRVLLNMKRFDEAAHEFDQLLRREPKLAWALAGLAHCHRAAGRDRAALAAALRATRIADADAACWHTLAETALKLDRLDRASAAAARMLALDPDDSAARELAGRIQDAVDAEALHAAELARGEDPPAEPEATEEADDGKAAVTEPADAEPVGPRRLLGVLGRKFGRDRRNDAS